MAHFGGKHAALLTMAGVVVTALAVGLWSTEHGGGLAGFVVPAGQRHVASPRPLRSNEPLQRPAPATRSLTSERATAAVGARGRTTTRPASSVPSTGPATRSPAGGTSSSATHTYPSARIGGRQSVSNASISGPVRIHLVFRRVWHPFTLEVGPASPPPSVTLVCPTCPPDAAATTDYSSSKSTRPPPNPAGSY